MTSGTSEGPRLRPLPPAEWPPEMRAALAALRPAAPRHPFPDPGGDRPKGLNVLGTLAHHPALTRAYHTFNGHVLFATTLSVRQRELLVLRVAAVRDAEYEWAQHVVLAGDAGIDDDEVDPGRRGPRRPGVVGVRRRAAPCRRRAGRRRRHLRCHLGGAGGGARRPAAHGPRVHRGGLRPPGDGVPHVPGGTGRRPSARISFSRAEIESIGALATDGRTTAHGALHEARRGLLDGALRASTPGPSPTTDSISPEHYELERDAIFRRTWLNVGRVEQLPRNGSYFTRELDAAAHLGHRRARHGRRGPRLPQHLPPPRQQAGVERLPPRGDQRHLPPVHLQVPRLALRPRRRPHLRAAGGRVLRPRQGRLRPRAGARARCGRGSSSSTSTTRTARRSRDYMGELGAGLEGYPFDRDDPGAQVPGRDRRQLEAVHRRLRRVLPRTDSAREAGGGRGVAQARRASATRRWPTTSTVRTAMVSSWGGMSPPKDLNMVKPIERVLRSGLFGPWDAPRHRRAAAGPQPGPPPGLGHRLVRASSRTSCC